MEKHEAFYVIGKRSVYGMDFQLEFGFYSTLALPRSVCCPVVALQQNPEPLLKLLCRIGKLQRRFRAKGTESDDGVFLRIVLLDFLGSSLSFQCRASVYGMLILADVFKCCDFSNVSSISCQITGC